MLKWIGATFLLVGLLTSLALAGDEPGFVSTLLGYEFSSYGRRWDVCDASSVLPKSWLCAPRFIVWNGIYPSARFAAQAKTLDGTWQDKEYSVGVRSWFPLGLRFAPMALMLGGGQSAYISLDGLYCPWTRFWLNTGSDTALKSRTTGSLLDLGGTLNLIAVGVFQVTFRAGYLRFAMNDLSRSVSATSGYTSVQFPGRVESGPYLGLSASLGAFQPPASDVRWYPDDVILVPLLMHPDKRRRLAEWEAGRRSAWLFAAVEDGDRDIRDSALTALGRVGDALAIDSLAAALTNREPDVRAVAAFALGRLGRDAAPATTALVKAFPSLTLSRDSDEQHYMWEEIDSGFRSPTPNSKQDTGSMTTESFAVGAWALERITGQRLGKAQSAWEEWVKHNPSTSQAGRVGPETAGDDGASGKSNAELRAEVDSLKFEVKRKAAPFAQVPFHLAVNRSRLVTNAPGVLDSLVAMLQRDGQDPAAAKEVSAISNLASVSELAKLMTSARELVRWTAVNLLGELGDSVTGLGLVAGALRDTSPLVRLAASSALAYMGDRRAVAPLVAAVRTERERLTHANATDLASLLAAAAMAGVIESEIAALGELKDSSAVDMLGAVLLSGDIRFGYSGYEDLGPTGVVNYTRSGGAVNVLSASGWAGYSYRTHVTYCQDRIAAAEALAAIGSVAALSYLVSASQDSNPAVRRVVSDLISGSLLPPVRGKE